MLLKNPSFDFHGPDSWWVGSKFQIAGMNRQEYPERGPNII